MKRMKTEIKPETKEKKKNRKNKKTKTETKKKEKKKEEKDIDKDEKEAGKGEKIRKTRITHLIRKSSSNNPSPFRQNFQNRTPQDEKTIRIPILHP